MNNVDECQDAIWTALPLADPASNTEFVPESLPYYTSIVLPAIWPAFLVTGLAAAFLLTLILWRAVRRCVLLARPRQLTHVARLRKVRALHRVRVWGAAGALCAAGVLVGVVLAGPWGGPHIVPRTFEVVDGARGYVAGVLGTADAAVADAEALNGTLADIQSFLGSNVDAPGLDASLECLRPWLDALPDVPTLLGTLDGAQTLLRGTVLPSLLRLQSGVGQLAADVGTAAAPGTATAALAHAATSRAGAVTLVAQAQALAALLEALATDLEALAATAGTLGDVAAALDALAPAATRLLNETLPALVAAFQGVQEGYGGVEPCVNALLAAAERVEARVLALPAALRGQLALLGEVHSALRTLSNVTTDWGAEVDGLADRLDVDAVLGGLRSPLQSMQGRLAGLGNLTATAQTLRDTAATMEAGEGALRTLRTLAAAASLTSARSVISSALSDVAAPLQEAHTEVLGRIDSTVRDVRPTADRWDTVRLVVMYVILILIGLLAVQTAAAIWLRWPAGVKLGAALIAIFLLLAGVAVLALTAGLKIGNDGCFNLEDQVLLRLSRLESPGAALTLAKYWLLNEGTVDEVAKQVLSLDVEGVLDQISNSREDLLEAIQNLTLRAPLQSLVDAALDATQNISSGILLLQDRLDYANVHPEYMSLKSYACCSILNTAGHLWFALLLVAGFGITLCVLCLPCIHSMDDVPKQGWGMRISNACLARLARPLASQGLEAGTRDTCQEAGQDRNRRDS
ncbi:hypothetical protein F751_6770 [Auxenochlorella protothecoides]|uniref:Uncharacterized protein n=1 Tax=Auxenochlorella protothecoides TaxID=3075 RepID=A0A087SDJ8_AUXPR|nr:hypothetical protein F751_6770 [Auxenochlorella protothecoides]KFM23802.1 hypothetical protein F751_6770 [Auxenochlorella protothecoides]